MTLPKPKAWSFRRWHTERKWHLVYFADMLCGIGCANVPRDWRDPSFWLVAPKRRTT